MSATKDVLWRDGNIPRKGRGMLAQKDISRGTCIIEETPLLQIPLTRVDLFDETTFYGAGNFSGGPHVFDQYNKISPEAQSNFRDLAFESQSQDWLDAQGRKPRPLSMEQWECLSRCQRNSFDITSNEAIDDGSGPKLIAAFHHISFCNHSCKPNAVFKWHPERGCGMVHALRDIKKKNEITLNYNSTIKHALEKRADRRQRLQECWTFQCRCTLCSSPAQDVIAMDAQRKQAWDDWQYLLDLPWPDEENVLDLRNDTLKWPAEYKDIAMDDNRIIKSDFSCGRAKVTALHREHRRIFAYFDSVATQFKKLEIIDSEL